MPTVLTHPAVPLALALGTGGRLTPPRVLAVGVVCSLLPDVDSLGFWAGVPYASLFGHRGVTHSLFFAMLVAAIGCAAAPALGAGRAWAFSFLAISTASHGLLDTCTNGGLGIALLSPFSNHRLFAPWRPIPVSPIGVHGLASSHGRSLFAAELLLVWLPCLALGLAGFVGRKMRSSTKKAVWVSVLTLLASSSASRAAHAQSADLGVLKAPLGGSPVTAGTNLTWWIRLENAGPDNAAAVSLVDTFPDGNFVSLSSPPGWSCTTPAPGAGPSGIVSCSIASLPIGHSDFYLSVHIAAETPPGCCLTNTAIWDSATPDPGGSGGFAMSAVAVAAPVPVVPTLASRGLIALIVLLAGIGALTVKLWRPA